MSDVQLARFSDVSSQGARFAEEMGVPLGAYQKMTAEEFFLVMSSPTLGGPFATDPGISEDQGLIAAIVKCSPGQGPYLHAHYNTLESFTCLSGKFRITWGDEGEHSIRLEPMDFISVPAGVYREFKNVGDDLGRLFVAIQSPEGENKDKVIHAAAAGEEIEQRWGKDTRDAMAGIGIQFGE